MNEKPPIINCHTHIFTGDNVPPYLAKTFVPWPIYYLLPLSLIVRLFRFWYNHPYTWQFKPWYKNLKETLYKIKMFIKRVGLLRIFFFLIGIILTVHAFVIIYDWLYGVEEPQEKYNDYVIDFRNWLEEKGLLFIPESFGAKIGLVLILVLFFKSGRNIIWFLLEKGWAFLGMLPGPQTKELARRYLNIGRFAFYKQQTRILSRLKNQYPEDTGFIILPMDMEYMEAGALKRNSQYRQQMQALSAIKNNDENKDKIFPFVFVEPRRIVEEGRAQFDFSIDNGTVKLEDCFIKEFIVDREFSGFKIYPALGYYPFDEALLPLWKYAADQGLPILTHCIRGTIYYRGSKKKEWDHHPVFNQVKKVGQYEALFLPETKNSEWINNFTHPLNYLCLLEEKLLREIVANANDPKIKTLFGYTDEITPLKYNLNHLKLCFGHFGGDDEWNRFIELDRGNYASQLVKHPLKGIDFLTDDNGNASPGKIEQIWKFVDWYSIICSLMLQYPNVYSDISYILHKPEIQPLLKQSVLNEGLRRKILFGTDFYVVRNHKSEKNMLANMVDQLDEIEFDQIARINPREFLKNRIHGPVKI